MWQICIATLIALLLGGCTSIGGTSSSSVHGTSEASHSAYVAKINVRIAMAVDLVPYNALAVVMPEYLDSQPDALTRVRKLGVFDQVIWSKDLPSFVINHDLQGRVTDFRKWSAYQALFHAYKPFLVIRFDCNSRSDGVYYSLIVTRPDNLKNIFVGDVMVMSRSSLNLRGLLTLGSGLYESNCYGAVDHGAVDALFVSMNQWLNDNIHH